MLTKFTADVENHQSLDNNPSDDPGFVSRAARAQALKILFDKAAVDIKNYINGTLLPELQSNLDAKTNTADLANQAAALADAVVADMDAMSKDVYDPDNDGKVSAAETADSVTWSGIIDPPDTYTPTAHVHGNITDDGKVGTVSNLPLFTGANGAIEAKTLQQATDTLKISNRNLLHNSAFQVNQRNVSGTVVLAAGAYGHDGWKAGAAGCTYTFETSGGVTTLTISAGSLIQIVEGINLETDTYCLSWNGTVQGKIGAGSFGAPGITGAVTGGTNLSVEFGTGTLSKPKLEQGIVATPYRKPKTGEQLVICKRYAAKRAVWTLPILLLSDFILFDIPHEVEMRGIPSIVSSASTFDVDNQNGTAQTGFTFALYGGNEHHTCIAASKVAHGCTAALLRASVLLSSEL